MYVMKYHTKRGERKLYNKRRQRRQYEGHHTPLGYYTDQDLDSHNQHDSQGEYCGLSTASEVFLIFITQLDSCLFAMIMLYIPYLDKREGNIRILPTSNTPLSLLPVGSKGRRHNSLPLTTKFSQKFTESSKGISYPVDDLCRCFTKLTGPSSYRYIVIRHPQQMVQMAFCDLLHTFHKQVTNVSTMFLSSSARRNIGNVPFAQLFEQMMLCTRL